jgi:excisionase family DNA binding protein
MKPTASPAVPGSAHAGLRPEAQPGELYRVPDAMRILSLSRSVIYELIRSGRLRSVKEGRTRLITAAAIRDYIALLEREAQEAA